MKRTYMYILLSAVMATMIACKDNPQQDEPRDWANTTEYFDSSDEKLATTYYKPYSGYVGDPMPFYDPINKVFRIMYLQEYRPNPVGTYHPIWGVETKDGANYTSLDCIIPCGGINEQDAALGTGSVIYDEASKLYYLFYTGHRHLPAAGEAEEAVLFATSPDFKTWTKNKQFLLLGANYGYSDRNFRDPYVFKGEDGKWHMLVSTHKGGKGVLAEFVSDNLTAWTDNGVFMSMMWDRFYECADFFKMGDWYYLVYSEQLAAIRRVQYFKGQTIDDLKACTKADAGIWPDDHEGFLDSRAYYAGKTASDGTNRYIWGWCPTRDGKDNAATAPAPAEPNWGGTLVAHKLIQHADGTLTLGEVPAISSKYNQSAEVRVMSQSDTCTLYSRLGYHNRISFTVTTSGAEDKFGISLVRGSDSNVWYSFVFNPESATRRKINMESEGPKGTGFIPAIDSYAFNTPADNTYNITIYTDNSVMVMYVNDQVCYTNRLYGIARNCWSINTYSGTIEVSNLKITNY